MGIVEIIYQSDNKFYRFEIFIIKVQDKYNLDISHIIEIRNKISFDNMAEKIN